MLCTFGANWRQFANWRQLGSWRKLANWRPFARADMWLTFEFRPTFGRRHLPWVGPKSTLGQDYVDSGSPVGRRSLYGLSLYGLSLYGLSLYGRSLYGRSLYGPITLRSYRFTVLSLYGPIAFRPENSGIFWEAAKKPQKEFWDTFLTCFGNFSF